MLFQSHEIAFSAFSVVGVVAAVAVVVVAVVVVAAVAVVVGGGVIGYRGLCVVHGSDGVLAVVLFLLQ